MNLSAFQVMPYTDDTAMTKSVAESLLSNKGFDPKDLAKRFTEEYIKEPKRGYGHNVIDVFAALNIDNYEQPFEPARKQFNGTGSYGNGAAMRTGPVPLFGLHLTDQELAKLATDCSLITHSNRKGYNGAILQSLAIREALNTSVSPDDNTFDVKRFLNNIIDKFRPIENDDNGSQNAKETPFTDKLEKMIEIFTDDNKAYELSVSRVVNTFGNNVSALKSVPTAIYSVLRAQRQIDGFNSENPFVRTLYYSISVGGDTDTIASMACSIAGALYGSDAIPEVLQKQCEGIDIMIKFADDLYDFAIKDKKE